MAGIQPWMTRRTFIRLHTGRLQRGPVRPLHGEDAKRDRRHPNILTPQPNLLSHAPLQNPTPRRANALQTIPTCLPTSTSSSGHTPTRDTHPTRNPKTHAYERRNGLGQPTQEHGTSSLYAGTSNSPNRRPDGATAETKNAMKRKKRLQTEASQLSDTELVEVVRMRKAKMDSVGTS